MSYSKLAGLKKCLSTGIGNKPPLLLSSDKLFIVTDETEEIGGVLNRIWWHNRTQNREVFIMADSLVPFD